MSGLSEADKQWIRDEIKRQLQEFRTESQEQARALVSVNSGQIVKMVEEASQRVFDSVVAYVDEEVQPQINHVQAQIDYKLEDGEGYTDAYRRAVERNANPHIGRITDGRADKRVITPEIRTFFTPDNSEAEDDSISD